MFVYMFVCFLFVWVVLAITLKCNIAEIEYKVLLDNRMFYLHIVALVMVYSYAGIQ